jgi:hypothetical protein
MVSESFGLLSANLVGHPTPFRSSAAGACCGRLPTTVNQALGTLALNVDLMVVYAGG